MPRRPGVDIVGACHVVHRGVERQVIYKDDEDHETFLQIGVVIVQEKKKKRRPLGLLTKTRLLCALHSYGDLAVAD